MRQGAVVAWSLAVGLASALVSELPLALPPWAVTSIGLGVTVGVAAILTVLDRRSRVGRSGLDPWMARKIYGPRDGAVPTQTERNKPMNDLIRKSYREAKKQRRSEVREALDAADVTKPPE